jgi:cytochrome b6-f complex iron-sulfur subunit
MMLEILAATAIGLLALAWYVRRAALRPVRVKARVEPEARAPQSPCGGTAMLMAAPTDVTTSAASAPAAGAAPARKPPQRKPSGPDRRTFLKWSMGLGWIGVLSGFTTASLAFIWPNLRSGFGARIPAGTPEDINSQIDANDGRFEVPEARALIVRYDPAQDPDGEYAEFANDTGFLALYQKCVHLGCKVPWCAESQWWECPCHGSKYNRWGEWQDGPAPRGLDRFRVEVVEGQVLIDTAVPEQGPSRSTQVLNQPAEGPHCQ